MFLDTEYFSSTGNYDANGSKQALGANSSFQTISMDSEFRYVPIFNLGLYSGLKFNNATANNGTVSRNTSALAAYVFGVDYHFVNSPMWDLYVDLSYSIAAATVNSAADSALASDGASEAKVVGFLTFDSDPLRFYTKLGGNYRTEGLSALLIYGLGMDYAFGNSKLGLAIDGISTVKDDDYTGQTLTRDLVTARVNAGSKRYYSINPNLLEGQLYYEYLFGKSLNARIYAGTAFTGSNTAEGMTAGLSLNWSFGLTKNTLLREEVPNKTILPNQEPGFKVDTDDGVDQKIFKPVVPPKAKGK